MFLARAHNYTNVFDASSGFMRGRNEDGSWIAPFDPLEPY
jgi:putative alpha-1,2-mannosidase